jgi:hypothetical protein
MNGMAPTTAWTKVARRLGLDHNPLRRRSDLIAGWLLPAAIVAFLILSPLVAGVAGLWMQAGNAAAQRAERSWHSVSAVLLQPAPGPLMSDNGANTWLVWTPARWIADGRVRTGDIPAPADTDADAVVSVWLDRAGHVQAPPLTPGAARDRVLAGMLAALAALAVLFTVMALVTRWVLDRRRLARWETAWLAVGPQWSRRA